MGGLEVVFFNEVDDVESVCYIVCNEFKDFVLLAIFL
jgi:hypothetical protein